MTRARIENTGLDLQLPPIRCDCGSGEDWIAADPGSAEQTHDGAAVLLRPIPAIPAYVWCPRCWPWLMTKIKNAPKPRGSRARS
jgi:hypothetical protein